MNRVWRIVGWSSLAQKQYLHRQSSAALFQQIWRFLFLHVIETIPSCLLAQTTLCWTFAWCWITRTFHRFSLNDLTSLSALLFKPLRLPSLAHLQSNHLFFLWERDRISRGIEATAITVTHIGAGRETIKTPGNREKGGQSQVFLSSAYFFNEIRVNYNNQWRLLWQKWG